VLPMFNFIVGKEHIVKEIAKGGKVKIGKIMT
jgi:hypothetical protein